MVSKPKVRIDSMIFDQIFNQLTNYLRTKWKRKYTSDLEVLAQQYYNSMGIHSARPIFVGDRLWLFNNGQQIVRCLQSSNDMRLIGNTNNQNII